MIEAKINHVCACQCIGRRTFNPGSPIGGFCGYSQLCYGVRDTPGRRHDFKPPIGLIPVPGTKHHGQLKGQIGNIGKMQS